MTINVEHRVHFYDTDTMGVVHHSNYIKWFELGRVEYLRKLNVTLGEMMNDDILCPITEIEAKYKSPARFDDEIVIETTATALTKVKMEFEYKVFRKTDNKILVIGRSQNVFTDKNTGKIIRLPEKYCTRLNI